MCGSVPYYYPGNNNVNDGELTFNYVDSKLSLVLHVVVLILINS